MIILTREQAGSALEEVGALQRSVLSGAADPVSAGRSIVEKMEGIVGFFGPSTEVYETIVEPLMYWVVHSITPLWMDPSADRSKAPGFRSLQTTVGAFYEKYEYLK